MHARDFGEHSQYRPEPVLLYEVEHNTVFAPMLRLVDLARRIGTPITYEIGAVGWPLMG